MTTPDQKLAWMIILATVPVGLTGVVFEHPFRVLFSKPTYAGGLPVILAAGALKVPDLFGPLGRGILGPILLGSVLSGIGAYLGPVPAALPADPAP